MNFQWTRFDDKKPKKGCHIFAIGNNEETLNSQWLWWGFYNPDREDGKPEKKAIFWCKMPPFPIMPMEQPEKKEECLEDESGRPGCDIGEVE